jgi:hypothetical protein
MDDWDFVDGSPDKQEKEGTIQVVDLKDLKPGFKLDLFMEQRMSTQEGMKKYGFNTPADKHNNGKFLGGQDDDLDDEDEDQQNRLFKKSMKNPAEDLPHKLSQTVRNQSKKAVNVSHDKRLNKIGSRSRFENRVSDFRLTGQNIMGKGIVKNDSRSNLPPLGRDPSKSKMETRYGSAMAQ